MFLGTHDDVNIANTALHLFGVEHFILFNIHLDLLNVLRPLFCALTLG